VTSAEVDGNTIYLATNFYNPASPIPGAVLGLTPIGLLQIQTGISTIDAATYQAIVLVHELGHILGGLPDDSQGGSSDNTKTIINACFSYLLN